METLEFKTEAAINPQITLVTVVKCLLSPSVLTQIALIYRVRRQNQGKKKINYKVQFQVMAKYLETPMEIINLWYISSIVIKIKPAQ